MEKDTEKERESVREIESLCVRKIERECVCVKEIERESVCVRER